MNWILNPDIGHQKTMRYGARAGIRTRVKRSAISQDIQATPRGQKLRKLLS